MSCINCGYKLSPQEDFCPFCGAWNIPIEAINLESYSIFNPIELQVETQEWWMPCSGYGEKGEWSQKTPQLIVIPELEKPENARWLALLTDAEGSMGWSRLRMRTNRLNEEYRHEYLYRIIFISITMDAIESEATIEEAARLIGIRYRTYIDIPTGALEAMVLVRGWRAVSTLHYCNPYYVKFRRMAPLLKTLYTHRVYQPLEQFDWVITQLFGEYLRPAQANRILLRMKPREYLELLKKAKSLADTYLRPYI
jgi:hypothetical protein